MPNWCSNSVTFKHNDAKQIERLVNGYKNNKLFSEFFPTPAELVDNTAPNNKGDELLEKYGSRDWYEWNVNNWGTKWDIGSDSYEDDFYNEGDNSVTISFESAWSPPLAFYENMVELGFEITAYYYESGMAFCGKFEDGEDEYFEIEGNSEWVKENIPNDIDEAFNISENMEAWEEEELEE